MKTPFQLHVEAWKDCTDCGLCEVRTHTVLAKGKIPCDILFLGEAPGKDENLMGLPFVGPAGRLLDEIIEEAVPSHYRLAFTNLIACAPFEEEGGDKLSEPPDESVRACAPRLIEFVEMADPRLIVCVGNQPKFWIEPEYKHRIEIPEDIPTVDIVHPAHTLRNSVAMRSIAVRRSIVTIQNAIKEFL
jgi:uracil-DNA glycosylase family 4